MYTFRPWLVAAQFELALHTIQRRKFPGVFPYKAIFPTPFLIATCKPLIEQLPEYFFGPEIRTVKLNQTIADPGAERDSAGFGLIVVERLNTRFL